MQNFLSIVKPLIGNQHLRQVEFINFIARTERQSFLHACQPFLALMIGSISKCNKRIGVGKSGIARDGGLKLRNYFGQFLRTSEVECISMLPALEQGHVIMHAGIFGIQLYGAVEILSRLVVVLVLKVGVAQSTQRRSALGIGFQNVLIFG